MHYFEQSFPQPKTSCSELQIFFEPPRRHLFWTSGVFFAASLFSDPGTSFSKPHAILNFNFFVGVKKKTFVFFLTAIVAWKKTALFAKLCTLRSAL